MSEPVRPWAELPALSNFMADVRHLYSGRGLFRVSVGKDWIRLHLDGDDRPALWLTWLPGASLVFSTEGPIPSPLKRALDPIKRHPLANLLKNATLDSAGMFPEDKVAALRLVLPDGRSLFLLHQLFGSRGNTVLLDGESKVLYARHRPGGPLVSHPPVGETWIQGEAGATGLGIARLAHGQMVHRLASHLIQTSTTSLNRVHKAADRLVANLQKDLATADKGELFRRKAETLAAHLHEIVPGQDQLEAADLRDGTPLGIALDPALAPAANLDAWFRKARKAEKGREIIAERLTQALRQADQMSLAVARLNEVAGTQHHDLDSLETILDWRDAHAALLPTAGGKSTRRSKHGPEEPVRPFRRYLIDGRFELWVGRNNKENDELTHRASHSRDIWFHAQGVPGSHVILRTSGKPETVSRSVLEKAAAVAALNSRARNSSLVPVIFTERRYVRKPRKSPPGAATCLQEKSLFAEPGIPRGVEAI